MYNVFARCWEGSHKQGSIGGSGACGIPGDATGYFYHNTSFSDATNPFHVTYNSRGAHKNRRYLNNIMMGSTNGPVVGDHANGGVTSTCSFDYDLLWRQSANNLWHWGGIQYNTLAEVQSTFGWELHGKNEQPLFVNAAQNDFRPTASSPSVDMGTLIRGINTPFKTQVNCQRRYCDVPDAGAFEYGTCSSGGCDLTPPAPSPMFNVWGGCEHIYVSWLSTGDDGNVGTATAYDLRWSDSPITTDAEFDLASPAPGPLPTPAAPGNLENYSVYLGNCGPHKYFALRIVDDFGNKSSLIFEANGAQPACIAPPEICAE
jgi:hypothetical protein